eukprot:Pgem_evm1s6407
MDTTVEEALWKKLSQSKSTGSCNVGLNKLKNNRRSSNANLRNHNSQKKISRIANDHNHKLRKAKSEHINIFNKTNSCNLYHHNNYNNNNNRRNTNGDNNDDDDDDFDITTIGRKRKLCNSRSETQPKLRRTSLLGGIHASKAKLHENTDDELEEQEEEDNSKTTSNIINKTKINKDNNVINNSYRLRRHNTSNDVLNHNAKLRRYNTSHDVINDNNNNNNNNNNDNNGSKHHHNKKNLNKSKITRTRSGHTFNINDNVGKNIINNLVQDILTNDANSNKNGKKKKNSNINSMDMDVEPT